MLLRRRADVPPLGAPDTPDRAVQVRPLHVFPESVRVLRRVLEVRAFSPDASRALLEIATRHLPTECAAFERDHVTLQWRRILDELCDARHARVLLAHWKSLLIVRDAAEDFVATPQDDDAMTGETRALRLTRSRPFAAPPRSRRSRCRRTGREDTTPAPHAQSTASR